MGKRLGRNLIEFSVRFYKEDWERIKNLADKQNLSMSAYLRYLVDRLLKEEVE